MTFGVGEYHYKDGAESMILSAPHAESMILSAPHTESMILSAHAEVHTQSMILSAHNESMILTVHAIILSSCPSVLAESIISQRVLRVSPLSTR